MIASWALFFAAMRHTSIGVATVVFHVHPLWLLAFGAWWLREPVSRRQWQAVLLALAGLALASGLLDGGQRLQAGATTGLLLCLAGSLCYAGVTLIAGRAAGASSFALAAWQCVVGTLGLAAWPMLHGWPTWGAAWAWLAGLGVVHTGLAYVVLYAGMARLPTGRVALLQFVYPAAAVALDGLVYGRVPSVMQVTGMALMAAALIGAKRSA